MAKAKKGLDSIEVTVPKDGATFRAGITAIEVCKAREVYGEHAKAPDRDVIRLSFEGPGGVLGTTALSAPGITGGKVVARNPKSNLYKYVKRYGAPRLGQQVDVRMDGNGFFRIVLE